MSHKLCTIGILLCSLVLCAPLSSRGQQGNSGPEKPLPPLDPASAAWATSPKPAATGSRVVDDDLVIPDSRPLAGAQNLTLGSALPGPFILLPSLGLSTQAQTNAYNSSETSSIGGVSTTYLTGRLTLNRASLQSQLLMDYLVGGTLTNDPLQGNSAIQNLTFSDLNQWGRWSVLFGDHMSYTSQSPFGFGGLGGLNNLGVSPGNGSGSGFRSGFLPSQSIFINGAGQVSNAVIGQTGYALSHRSSLTFVGSYGILDFINAGFLNNSGATFQAGYNYLLDRVNSITVFYRFNSLTFSGLSQGIQDHSVQLSYARRITGRLSFQVGAGPDVLEFRSPLSGPSRVASWAGSAALKYQHRSFGVGLNYDHSLTGGSGLLLGAMTDLVFGTVSHAFNRTWEGAASVGYSANQPLQQTTPNANTFYPKAWFGNVRVSRHFVGYGSLFLDYNISGQTGLAAICSQAACRVNSRTNAVTIGYNWGLRPVVLE